ncbi:TSUP family transporter, partial [Actinomadura sp. 7K507]|uniref:TSUP family transporter n=1 Tax=Actinomadura sp. 7K507 TaxID=2530365 RepID=UPI0010DBF1E0
MAALDPAALVALALIGLVAGVGITSVGPGGVLATVGLFALTPLSPAQVAGTAIVTNVATGVLGTVVYTRSGQLREPGTRRTAVLLSAGAVAGTPLGVLVNGMVTGRVFG